MGIIARYVRWIGHDAAGTLPPLDVLAGILRPEARSFPGEWSEPESDRIVVLVPAQWIGDWETGHALAPAYQYLWHAPLAQLYRLSDWVTEATSYRPDRLPDSATGPRQRRAVRSPRARLPR